MLPALGPHWGRGLLGQAGEAFNRCRFAGAIRSEESVKAAGRHGEIDSVNRTEVAKVPCQPHRLNRQVCMHRG